MANLLHKNGEAGIFHMGQPRFFRQRILTQAASLEAKGLFNYLVSEIKRRREVSLEEAILIARDVEGYLEGNLLKRACGQIEFPAIAGRDNHKKRARKDQPERLIKLTVVAEEDIELLAEFGVVGLQVGRLARVIEEAYFQDAILDYSRLLVLFLETHKGLRHHLEGLWQEGVLLPVAGMKKESRSLMKGLRAVVAIERYLEGEDLTEVRKRLGISMSRWQRWWQDFKEVARQEDKSPEELSSLLGEPKELVGALREAWKKHKDRRGVLELVGFERGASETSKGSSLGRTSPKAFYELLCKRHGYSPAAAEAFLDELYEIAARLNRQERALGQIVYNAVADHEPAGRRLIECEMRPVVLDYVAPEDFELANRDSQEGLKWARLTRLVTQARNQGVALTQPDLSLLLGMSTAAIKSIIDKHPNVILPTRGVVADMGPALSHADKIIRLFMDGYTETEIVRRTGHTYESVERYLLDFSKVVYLVERGMPVPAIRKVLGFSRRLVQKYVGLYEEFCGPDYIFMMAKIRRMAQAHPVDPVKKNGKGV